MAAVTRAAVVLVAAVLLLAGCGSSVRNYIGDHYHRTGSSGDTSFYHSDRTVSQTTAQIVAHERPAAQQTNAGDSYLRYRDQIVIVSPNPSGGSNIRVESIHGRFSHGAFLFLGPGFRPGSPAGGRGGGGGPSGVK